jgi:serine/threonine protein kinase
LVDFGIAKVGGAGQKTATGARGVTPGFSPPEQYLATGEIDVRSDIYSLGATMYFLLTGKVPPDATERLQREMAGQPSLEPIRSVNAAVSQQVEQAIMIAMALRKEQRFNNVGEFLAGLKGQTIQPPMPQPSPQQPMPQPPVQPPAMQPSSVPGPARTQASKQAGKVKEFECYLCGSTIAPDEPRYRRYVLKGFSLGSYSSSGYRSSHGTSLSFGKSARFGSSDRYGSSHRYGSSRREHYSLQTICRQCALRMRNKQLAYHSGGAGVLCAILGFLLFGWKGAVLGFIGAVLGFIAGFAVVYVLLSRQPLSPGPD